MASGAGSEGGTGADVILREEESDLLAPRMVRIGSVFPGSGSASTSSRPLAPFITRTVGETEDEDS